MGGGGFSMEPDNPLLDDYVLTLTQHARPRVCFVPTASGDADSYLLRFYQAFATKECVATHLPLFRREFADLCSFLCDQHVIYVGGGNTVNMLAIWRAHGVDVALREAWERGVVLCGLSAGSLCWFDEGITDSFGSGLQPLEDGLGFLAGSHCPHFDGEAERRPAYHEAVERGMSAGYAADDGAALHFVGSDLSEVVSSRAQAAAYRVECVDGVVRETRLPVRHLGADALRTSSEEDT